MWSMEDIENGGFWTSLSKETERAKILKALGQADLSGQDLEKNPMQVSDILIHKVTVATDSGDRDEFIRTVLISPDGKTCAFVSDGVLGSIRNICMVFGEPKWNPAIKVKAVLVKTRRGFRTYNLEVVE